MADLFVHQSTVIVVDADVLIDLKSTEVIPLTELWGFLVEMADMVDKGKLVFPEQVKIEVADTPYPDAPGTWVAGVHKNVHQPFAKISDDALIRVQREHPALIGSPDRERARADPYVIAMAMTLQQRGIKATVSSKDQAVQDACFGYSIPTLDVSQFVRVVNQRIQAR